MSETVSVIVPCYKVEPYLTRCVDSILRQTYRDLEVILVDDGSPDRCGELCDEYAATDPRVLVVHQSNRGLSAARNSGLELMTGQFVLFVDGDDWLDVACVETLHRILVETEADIAVSNLLRTSDEQGVLSAGSGQVIVLSREDAIHHILKPRYGSMVAACGKLFPASLFDHVRFPTGRLHEDAFTTYRLILHSRKIALTTSPLYVYWQRPDSIMGSPFNPRAALDIIDALTERSRVLRDEGMETSASISSGQVLATYMQLLHHAAAHPSDHVIPARNLRALALRLQGESQPLKFRAFYVMAVVSPWAARRIHACLAAPRDE